MNKLCVILIIVTFLQCLIAKPFSDKNTTENDNKNQSDDLEFILLHNNDLHSRFEQTDVNCNKCTEDDQISNKCYGGFARITHLVKRFREKSHLKHHLPVLYLNAGDTYSGTVWFTVYKHKIVSEFMNLLKPDAMTLGNHEFDKGVKGLIPFLNNSNFPIVTTNLDLSQEPKLAMANNLYKSTVVTIKNTKIGIIGYLTPDTMKTSSTDNVKILPEINEINKEALKLKSEGVKIMIGLGHSGFEKDKEIAAQCPDIDIVVGGHTNTFLYNGNPPSIEIPESSYPVTMVQANGKRVPVVQAYGYGKYLGYLKLKFNSNGDLLEANGNPILLDSTIPQDADVLKLLDVYRPNITALSDSVIGKTDILLDGSRAICRKQECSMGNVIADSMIYAREKQLNQTSDAAIAFVNSGGIRSSIEKKSDGAITNTDILDVVPFNNPLYVANVKGDKISNALELSADNYHLDDKNGGFLQMSGVQVMYKMSNPSGERVVDVKVKNPDTNEFENLDMNKNYKIVFTKYLLKGGDGHKWTDDKDPLLNAEKIESFTDSSALVGFIKDKGQIKQYENDRIVLT